MPSIIAAGLRALLLTELWNNGMLFQKEQIGKTMCKARVSSIVRTAIFQFEKSDGKVRKTPAKRRGFVFDERNILVDAKEKGNP